jgi:hypothetical protein
VSFSLTRFLKAGVAQTLLKQFALKEVDLSTNEAKQSAIEFMDREFQRMSYTRKFFARLCKGGDEETRKNARHTIFSVFIDQVAENGALLRSHGADGSVACETWWIYERVPTAKDNLAFLWKFISDIFWRGLSATGFKKLFYGMGLLKAAMSAAPKNAQGKPVDFLSLENAATVPGAQNARHATAHMALGCLAAAELNVPVRICLTKDDFRKPLFLEAGFEDMGRIKGIPKQCPFYEWMLWWPNKQKRPLEEIGREFLTR